MQLPVLYALVAILALMALFDIMSTTAVLMIDPQHYREGDPPPQPARQCPQASVEIHQQFPPNRRA